MFALLPELSALFPAMKSSDQKKYPLRPRAALILLLMVISGCISRGSFRIASLSIQVPPSVPVSGSELRALLPNPKEAPGPETGTLEVVVLRYSPGIYKLSYTGKEFTEKTGRGYIRVLLKFRQGGKLVKTDFLEARGTTREELMKNVAKKINALISTPGS